MSANDRELIEDAMQEMRDAIRGGDGTKIEASLGWIKGNLKRLRIGDEEIEKAMEQIKYRAHWLDERYKKELPEQFLELERLLIRKLGIKPSK